MQSTRSGGRQGGRPCCSALLQGAAPGTSPENIRKPPLRTAITTSTRPQTWADRRVLRSRAFMNMNGPYTLPRRENRSVKSVITLGQSVSPCAGLPSSLPCSRPRCRFSQPGLTCDLVASAACPPNTCVSAPQFLPTIALVSWLPLVRKTDVGCASLNAINVKKTWDIQQ